MKRALIIACGAWMWLCGVVAVADDASVASPADAGVPHVTASQGLDDLFYATGVLTEVSGISRVIDDELKHLAASPLFAPADIAAVRERMGSVREDALYARLESAVQTRFTPAELIALQAWVKDAGVQTLLDQERRLQESAAREQWRAYRQRLKETPALPERIALMQELDDLRGQTALETALKVEIRKHLLAAVARVKTGKAVNDVTLAQELRDYQEKVGKGLRAQAVDTYLFFYRQTPSDRLQAVLTHFRDPLFDRWMAVVGETLKAALSEARNQPPSVSQRSSSVISSSSI